MQDLLSGGAALALFASLSLAQLPAADAGAQTRQRFEAWKAAHGPGWTVFVDRDTGRAEFLGGGSAAPAFAPASEAELSALALLFVEETRGLTGLESATLTLDQQRFLPLGALGSSDKIAVRFRQELGGVPVLEGYVNVLHDLAGSVLSLQSTALPDLIGTPTRPRLAGEEAVTRASALFEAETGLPVTHVDGPRLGIAQRGGEGHAMPALVWEVDVRWQEAGAEPEGYVYRIDALDGSLVSKRTSIHHFDVGGTVRSNATPGLEPDAPWNPPAPLPMHHLRVTSSAGTVFSDSAGNFNFPGVNGPLTCTFTYVGSYATVNNEAGAEHSISATLTGTGNSVLMNPSPTEHVTSQANAFDVVGILRDWVRSVDPGDDTADFQAVANVNINSNCNAFFDGGSINFYVAGSGCQNSAFTTIIVHEMGHWLNVLYGTGNSSDGMGEGNADVFSEYVYDTHCLGQGFSGGQGSCGRSGLNTRQFCGDCCPGCHGGAHNNGEVWMGAAWKVRTYLNATHGDALGDAIADALFSGWMNAYDQTELRSVIETQWLTLDDVDGNIGNGTPNYPDIDQGFRDQGFPGFDLDAIFITGVTELPDTQDEAGPYVVEATITAAISPPLVNATLYYRVGGGAFTPLLMGSTGVDQYEAAIPGQQSPAEVEYYLEARDNAGVTETWPPDAPGDLLAFRVGVLTTFLFNDFEGATDEGWTVGAPGDDATTGTWERIDPVATDAQPGDDHTDAPGVLCWVTGQHPGGGVGENDVDGGRTTLVSPVFDASALNDPEIRYWRWFSNDAGASPGTDVFVVEISNDGGGSWTNVETVGPGGPEVSGGWFEHSFDISDFVAPTASMRLRFAASDEGSGSIVEAAIDDIEGVDLGPVDDCSGSHYCVSSPNSVGPGAEIAWSGSLSVGQNDTTLHASGAPPGQPGIFFYGVSQTQIPFGNGFRCTGGTTFRLPVTIIDGSGAASWPLDITSPPAGGQIESGDTWRFQFWYRDPAAGGANFNLSDALSLTFCD